MFLLQNAANSKENCPRLKNKKTSKKSAKTSASGDMMTPKSSASSSTLSENAGKS